MAYEEHSSMELQKAVASICLVWRDKNRKEILLIRKSKNHPHYLAGEWFFPGGGVEPEEQPIETAIRETEEETGIQAQLPKLLDVYAYTEHWSNNNIDYHQRVVLAVYEAFYQTGAICASDECEEARWIERHDLSTFLSPDILNSHLSKKVKKILKIKR